MAGLISLGGVALGFVFYILSPPSASPRWCFAVPYAYDALRFAARSICCGSPGRRCRPGGRSPFQVRDLAQTARASCSRWG